MQPQLLRDRGAYVGSDLAEAGFGNRLDNKVRWATSRAGWPRRTQVDILTVIAIAVDAGLKQSKEVEEPCKGCRDFGCERSGMRQ